jgi:hypothetical protein
VFQFCEGLFDGGVSAEDETLNAAETLDAV